MSKSENTRRLAVLGVVVVALGAIGVWRFTSAGSSESNDSAAATKAQEMNERFEAAGGSVEPVDAGGEDLDQTKQAGPQSVDD